MLLNGDEWDKKHKQPLSARPLPLALTFSRLPRLAHLADSAPLLSLALPVATVHLV